MTTTKQPKPRTHEQRATAFANKHWDELEKCNAEQDAWWDQGRIGSSLNNALTYLNTGDLVTARYVINRWGSEKLLKAFDKVYPSAKPKPAFAMDFPFTSKPMPMEFDPKRRRK